MGVGGQRHAPASLRREKRPGAHCIGSWMGLVAATYESAKPRAHRGLSIGPSST